MLDLNSMGIADIQNTITLIKSQVTTYKTTLTSYKVAYNNATSKLADARQMADSVKSQAQTLPNQLPLPTSLFTKSTTGGTEAASTVEVVSLQNLKTKMEDKITDLEDTINELEGWQQKLEKRLEELNKKAQEYGQKAKDYVVQKAMNTVNTVTTSAQKLITKTVSKGQAKVTTTISNVQPNNLTNNPLT